MMMAIVVAGAAAGGDLGAGVVGMPQMGVLAA
jgi:hypothetical protein